jgi:hypothetical protein
MQTAYNPDTGDTLVLVDNEWVKPAQVAKNDAGEAAYLINNQWVLPGQDIKPAAPTGMIGQAVDYLGDQANILKKDVQVGLINTELSVKQAQLAEKMNLQEGRIGEFGPVAQMPEVERKKHAELQKSIEKDLLDVVKLSNDVRGIQATGGRKTTAEFQELPQQKEYKEGDFWKKAAMTGEAFIKDPIGIATDIGLQSLPQSLAVAATAIAARLGQVNVKATAAAGGASSAMAEFGGIYADLREQGIPHKEAWEQAGVKSGVIGLFDAASFYSAGSAMSQIAKDLSKGSLKGTAKEVAKETGKQAALGASGEALGSTAINQAIDPVSVLSEAVGEVFGAPGEALSTYRGQPKAAPTPTPAPGVAPSAAPVETAPPSSYMDTAAEIADLTGQQPIAPETIAEQPVVEKQQAVPEPKVVPVDAPITPLSSTKEPEATAKPAPEMKPATFAERMKNPDVQESLKRYAAESGWSQRGGLLLRENADDNTSAVIGRTQWTPNASWWTNRPVVLRGDIDGAATRKAINKAYRGEILGKNEKQMVEFLIGMHDFDMQEGDRQRAELEERDRQVAEFNKQFEVPATEATPTEEDIQAEMDRKAEEARASMPPPAGELDEDIPFAKATAPTEQQRTATEMAADVLRNDGRETEIVYQDGDIALAKTRKKNGDVIYVPFRGARYATLPSDVSTDIGKGHMKSLGLSDAQQQEFIDIRNKLEKAEEEKHAKEPFLKMQKGVTGSAGVSKNIVNVARGWAKMLGIKGDIHIMTVEEARANKDKFTGPHRPIGYMGTMVEFGAVRELNDGSYALVISPSTSMSRTMETLAHELGHIHEWQVFNNADKATQKQIIGDFNVWLTSQKGKSIKELVESLRAKTTAQQTEFADPMASADYIGNPAYWKSFREWYADQVSRWAVSSEKPLTVVDKFFKKLADALKKFYQTVKGQKYLPSASMKDFLDGIARQSQLNEIVDRSNKGQMALFAQSFVDTIDKTDTPEFKRWFGNSKIVNEDGTPQVMYHITPADVSKFIPGGIPDENGYLSSGKAIWLSPNKESQPAAHNINGNAVGRYREGVNVMPLYVKMERPLVIDDRGMADWARDVFAEGSREFPLLMPEKWVKEVKDAGYDGIIWKSPYSHPDSKIDHEYIVFDANQVKSAIGNTGEFNPENPDIAFSKQTVEAAPKVDKHRNIDGMIVSPVWTSPEVSKVDNLLYKLQDKHIDTKRVIQAIQKEAGDLDDKWNVYLKEELYHGRTSAALRKFLLQDLMPTIKQMSKLGITPDDMKEYLHNRHAKERNDQIAKIRPATLPDGTPNPSAMTDKGSGLSYKQIDEYFDKLDPSKAKKLEDVAKEFDKMIAGTQNILVASGAENQETINAWNKTYKHYVPLFRVDDDFATHPSQGTGAGFSSSGGSSKRATGSEKEVQDILGNILAQRERALIKAEKIRVGQALYGLAIKNPNPDFWLPINPDAVTNPDALAAELDSMGLDGQDITGVMEEMKKPEVVMDRQTGLQTVRYKINPLERYKDHVFPVRVNGKDRYIFFNQNDPRAKRMVEAMKNLDTEQLGSVLGLFGKFTRWFSAVNTQYNPVFGGINFLRDTGGAQFNLSTTKIAGKQGEVNAVIFPAMKAIWSTLKAERNGQPLPKTDMANLWDEFKTAGGQTLYRDSLVRKAEEKQLIEHELNRLKRGAIRKSFSGAVQLLSDFNDTIENAVRLAAYKVAIDNGLSKEQAASIAKNLTVNFDRKGQIGSRINALWAFFNASMQGSARLMETLRGPQGRKIIAGGILLGVAQSIALGLAGFDEDEPPEFLKERNLIIPLGGKKYFLIPMPLGLHFIPTIGRVTTDFVLNSGKDPGKHVLNIVGTGFDAFNPLGGGGLSFQTIAPTVLDPLAALEANKDAFGRPIYRADRATNPTPGYSRSRESASTINKYIAEFLNYASGGTKYQKGAVSPTADALDYLVGQFTGGVGREVMKVDTAVKSAVTGEELPAYRIPIAGRFYGDADSKAADSQRFYDNVTKISSLENEIKGRRKNREDVAGFMRDNPQSRLWQQANNAENQISELNRRKRDFQERGLPREKILAIDNQKQAIMKRFNDRVKELER